MQNLTIVTYHYVRPIKKSSYPLIKGLELESFKIQLDYLEKNYKIITMESLINFAKNSAQLPDSPCLLTFDDGYKDHYLYVFPELKKRGIQGSFFSVAKTVLEKKILDINKIHFILAKEPNANLLIKKIKKLLGDYTNKTDSKKLLSFDEYWKKYAVANTLDTKEIVFLKRILQHALPENIRVKICDFLFDHYIKKNQKKFASELYVTNEELKEMIQSNMYFGSHSYKHPWLNTLSKNFQLKEIEKGLNFLNKIGAPTIDWVMNYPYGAYNSDTLDILKAKDCCIGLTMNRAVAELRKEKFLELPRFRTNDFPSR